MFNFGNLANSPLFNRDRNFLLGMALGNGLFNKRGEKSDAASANGGENFGFDYDNPLGLGKYQGGAGDKTYDKNFGIDYNNPLGLLTTSGLDLLKNLGGKSGNATGGASPAPAPAQAARQMKPVNYGTGVPVFGDDEPITVQDADGKDYTYTPGQWKNPFSDLLAEIKARDDIRRLPTMRTPPLAGVSGGKTANGVGGGNSFYEVPADIAPVPTVPEQTSRGGAVDNWQRGDYNTVPTSGNYPVDNWQRSSYSWGGVPKRTVSAQAGPVDNWQRSGYGWGFGW